MITSELRCPCDTGLAYADCCGPCHQGLAAPDARALMRSRYSAFVRGLPDYLLATWHPDTRPDALDLSEPSGQRTQWLGLKVNLFNQTGPDTAEVAFVARYKVGGGSAIRLVEHSRFECRDGRWYYLDAL